MRFQEAAKQQWDLIVLPGGAVGAETMRDSTELIGILAKQKADGKLVGASGATPSIVLASMHGFLQEGATCFPLMAFRNAIPKASDNDVVVHDNVVTSQGIGSALVFALMLVELLYDPELADRIAQTMLIDRTKHRYFPPALNPKLRMMREQELEALTFKNEKFGKEEQMTPTKNPKAGKESDMANANIQKDSTQLAQQSIEAAVTETWGGDSGNEHQGERLFNDASDCLGTSACDEQSEESICIDILDSEGTSSQDSLDSDSSWDGESTCNKRKYEPSSKNVEPRPKRNVCYDVEEKICGHSILADEYYIKMMMMSDTMNRGGTITTAETCNGMDHSGHTVIPNGWSDQLG
jgi:DJ-1/PfpI family